MKRAGARHARARKGTTDTGAQLTVINIAEPHTLGIKLDSIFSVAMYLNTVTAAFVDLVGGGLPQVHSLQQLHRRDPLHQAALLCLQVCSWHLPV